MGVGWVWSNFIAYKAYVKSVPVTQLSSPPSQSLALSQWHKRGLRKWDEASWVASSAGKWVAHWTVDYVLKTVVVISTTTVIIIMNYQH